MKQILERIIEKEHLTISEAYSVMMSIMEGEINNSQLAGFLTALKSKGETAEEIAGFAKAMRDKAIPVYHSQPDAIDVCGTGGDASGTFNISTATAFVVAGAGVPIAKHGNRSISSNCGSADVLQQLGIDIALPAEAAAKAIDTIGIAFLFAPNYHPSMKHAGEARKQLAIKTVFNMLGPLSNPAKVNRQIIGVYSDRAADKMCAAAEHLEINRIAFLCTDGRFDEILLHGTTRVLESNGTGKITEYSLSHLDFQLGKTDPQKLLGGTAAENADIILHILKDKIQDDAFNTVVANSAMALLISGRFSSLEQAVQAATESILSGAAYDKLCMLRNFKDAA